jgi:hypothetical protein
MINKTGANSVKGIIVDASSTTADAFGVVGADDPDPIGIIYDEGVPDGQLCRIVDHGPAQVLLQNSTAATLGFWVKVSDTIPGRADATNASPPGGTVNAIDDHFTEVGHCLESVTAGTDKLCWVMHHQN